jgi:two-component system chemotaxis response regulator CheB
MGKDGLEGARKIKSAGGRVIIQDEASSVVWGMPRAIFKAGLADEVLPVSKIPAAILKYINAN